MTVHRKHIFICENLRDADSGRTSCAAHHNAKLRAVLKSKIRKHGLGKEYRVNRSGCLGQCAYGPVLVIYPQGIWYYGFSEADMDDIITQSVRNDNDIARLAIKEK